MLHDLADADAEPALHHLCRTLYCETSAFYSRMADKMGASALGYRVLYGPPVFDAEILFLGYQPGGRFSHAEKGRADGHHETWPVRCDYAAADWPLAKRLRKIFGEAFLERCTGTNINFFRAPSIQAWRSLPAGLRVEMERFSREQCEALVTVLRPKRILIIGLGTFDAIAEGQVALHGSRRVLAKEGTLWGIPTIGVVHLSGARVSCADQAYLKQFLTDHRKAPAKA